MKVSWSAESYKVILKALEAYYASLEEGHPDVERTKGLIERVHNLLEVGV